MPGFTRESRIEPTAGPSLAVLIVNYNSWPEVERLVESLGEASECSRGRCEIVVVDNASDGQAPRWLSWAGRAIRLILRPDNGGFATGVNAGWRSSRARWLLLLNSDVEAGPDLVGRVLAVIDRLEARGGPPTGIVGFGLRNADGSRQPSVGRFPTLGKALAELCLPRGRRRYRTVENHRAGQVPWVTGACLLVRRDLLDSLGGMDEDFFLYYEEVALCREAWDRGWGVEFDPSIEVVHLRPLQSRTLSPRMRVITRHSKLLYFHKHLPSWQFRGLAAIVALEASVRGVWSGVRRNGEERASWNAISAMVAAWRRTGRPPLKGPKVRILADSVAERGGTIPIPSNRKGRIP